MSRQWISGDLRPLRAAARAWVSEACSALGPNRSLRWRYRTPEGGEGFESRLELDAFETARLVRTLGNRTPSFDELVRVVAEHGDVFDRVPALDNNSPEISRLGQREAVALEVAEPLLRAYIKRSGNLQFNEELFNDFFDGVERDLRAAATPSTAYVPLAHVTIRSDPIELMPGAWIRQPTATDREDWMNRPHIGSRDQLRLLDVKSVLEIRYDEPKTGPGTIGARNAQELTQRLETALQLHLNCDAHSEFVQFRREAVFGAFFGGTVSGPSRFGRIEGELTPTDVGPIRELEAALRSSVNLDRCAIALRRWDDVCARGRHQDTIVDSWVGLESLLFAGKEGEVTLRTSIRLAALIGRDATERREIFTDVRRRAYNARSTVLHGADTSGLDLPRLAGEARDYFRRALMAALLMPVPFDPRSIEADLVAAGWTPGRGEVSSDSEPD